MLLSHKKGDPVTCDNMDGLEGIIVSEVSQRKINMISLAHEIQ